MTYTTRELPADGADIAVDAVAGIGDLQLTKIMHGAEGEARAATPADPIPVGAHGEMMETLQAMRMLLHALTRTIGLSTPDSAGRLRISIDATPAVLSISSVSSMTTLGNQTSIGGNSANPQIPALMQIASDSFRRNIVVS